MLQHAMHDEADGWRLGDTRKIKDAVTNVTSLLLFGVIGYYTR